MPDLTATVSVDVAGLPVMQDSDRVLLYRAGAAVPMSLTWAEVKLLLPDFTSVPTIPAASIPLELDPTDLVIVSRPGKQRPYSLTVARFIQNMLTSATLRTFVAGLLNIGVNPSGVAALPTSSIYVYSNGGKNYLVIK